MTEFKQQVEEEADLGRMAICDPDLDDDISSPPRVSIGLCVYNGEQYVRQAINSLLAQTYQEFELIICDNASTDSTRHICQEHAEKDSRIRYFCNPENIGGARNFNRAFELARGEYFMWAAHDDLFAPDFVARAVEVLDSDRSAVLAYSKARNMNSRGVVREECVFGCRPDSPDPCARFSELLRMRECYPVYGLIRKDCLRMTPLMSNYPMADKVLLVRLGLMGRFREIPEYLYFRRVHRGQSVRMYPSYHLHLTWFDPSRQGRIVFPRWRVCKEYFATAAVAKLTRRQKIKCFIAVISKFRWLGLFKDLAIAVGLLFH